MEQQKTRLIYSDGFLIIMFGYSISSPPHLSVSMKMMM